MCRLSYRLAAAMVVAALAMAGSAKAAVHAIPPPPPPPPPAPTLPPPAPIPLPSAPNPEVTVVQDPVNRTFGGDVGVGPTTQSSTGAATPSGPRCTWEAVLNGESSAIDHLNPNPAAQLDRPGPDGRRELAYRVICSGQANQIRWVIAGITIDDLIDGASDRARRQIPLPQSQINPPPEGGGGIVNLGMWLAVAPEADRHVHVEAAGMWVDITAHLHETTFEFGNGDSETCEGTGTPISNLDTVEEGPCGYTYTEIPPLEPYQLTITSTWTFDVRTSAGPRTLNPMPSTTTIDYKVREIITVGECSGTGCLAPP